MADAKTVPAFTERRLVDAVMADRWRKNFCLPNYTPTGWWECDVFELTAAGYFREYEVKISVADFRADAKKAQTIWSTGRWETAPSRPSGKRYVHDYETKHGLLAKADPRCPSQFNYVTPEGLLDRETLPPWAGWIEVMCADPSAVRSSLFLRQRVEAPRIHRMKMKANPNHHRGTCYYRMHQNR